MTDIASTRWVMGFNLRLHYQPKVAHGDSSVLGVEGLVRWQHPRQGLLAPDRFLPQIKDTPPDNALGEWVINTALAQQQSWYSQGVELPVSLTDLPASNLLNTLI